MLNNAPEKGWKILKLSDCTIYYPKNYFIFEKVKKSEGRSTTIFRNKKSPDTWMVVGCEDIKDYDNFLDSFLEGFESRDRNSGTRTFVNKFIKKDYSKFQELATHAHDGKHSVFWYKIENEKAYIFILSMPTADAFEYYKQKSVAEDMMKRFEIK